MKIIVSPAKKMQVFNDAMLPGNPPVFLEEAKTLLSVLKAFSQAELRDLFKANEKITRENFARYQGMDLERNLSPAALTYIGIQYQYMAPHIFTDSQWQYLCKNLCILSGFYGLLRADDGIVPYRLEMQALLKTEGHDNLYSFWGDKIYRELVREDREILNLASKEYSKAVEPYLEEDVRFVSCIFGTLAAGKVKVKATEAKMARGEMVKWLSENQVRDLEQVKGFAQLGFTYEPELSDDRKLVFIKGQDSANLHK